ncbi:FAD-binding oxidoreductase [Pedobacter sp. SYSU D00535]|uniref:FAD-binding oxidoreductase n=1 Tax=Pedobacter sp. SYSU D00535 TaxID=2810308 RepID=UPI001A979384|nr:FAD-binding oxidoreductase [Pedobacter sp. SYSU D00535]
MSIRPLLKILLLLILSDQVYGQSQIINDITQLNPIRVQSVICPTTTKEIAEAVKGYRRPISIGGGRYSMGGQTATEQALQIDMRNFDAIKSFSPEKREITVQAGITWRKIQEHIDPHNLSVKIMQTYANFTVGGSLSVNVHGRYLGQGPLILSVKEIKLVVADGTLITASPAQHPELFYGAIGGYGALGVITEATLYLTENVKVERTDHVLPLSQYKEHFLSQLKPDSTIIFHNADIYPRRYKKLREISYRQTDKPLTIPHRLKSQHQRYRFNRVVFKVISGYPGGKWLRQHLIDPILYKGQPVEWRNYEASYDVFELEPRSRKRSTYVLQEYFVPVENFDAFYPVMVDILKKNRVNVINISIRHAKQDPGSLLAWARTDVFAFVIYYKQGTRPEAKEKVTVWTRQLVDAAIASEGAYYLPYQIHASEEQFRKAYPNAETFFELKKQVDPNYKFRNKLWDAYYR